LRAKFRHRPTAVSHERSLKAIQSVGGTLSALERVPNGNGRFRCNIFLHRQKIAQWPLVVPLSRIDRRPVSDNTLSQYTISALAFTVTVATGNRPNAVETCGEIVSAARRNRNRSIAGWPGAIAAKLYRARRLRHDHSRGSITRRNDYGGGLCGGGIVAGTSSERCAQN